MGQFKGTLFLTLLGVFVILVAGADLTTESELIASMRQMHAPEIEALDHYAAYAPNHSRFRIRRGVRFEDDSGRSPDKKSAEALSASFGIGPNGLSGSISAAQSDGEKTKGYFGAYPHAAGYPYPHQPPPFYPGQYPVPHSQYPINGPGGFLPSTSSAAAAAGSSGGGHPYVPILNGPVSHSAAAASASSGSGAEGYYPGAGGYYPPYGYPGQNYGYPGGYGGGGYGGVGGGYYRPNYYAPPGGLYGAPGFYPPSGPGFYGQGYPGGFYGAGGFRKGEREESERSGKGDSLNKNYNHDRFSGSSSSGTSSKGGVVFKDN